MEEAVGKIFVLKIEVPLFSSNRGIHYQKHYTALSSKPAESMNISLILAHPKVRSFNHAIAEVAQNTLVDFRHHVDFHDLYQEKFDPILSYEEIPKKAKVDAITQKYCDEIASADGIIIVHPKWWGMPPAILKGWMDRVIRPGVAYEFLERDGGEGVPKGLLKTITAIVVQYIQYIFRSEHRVFSDPLEKLWGNCIFGLCGVKEFCRTTYGVIETSSLEQRKAWLEDVRITISKNFQKD